MCLNEADEAWIYFQLLVKIWIVLYFPEGYPGSFLCFELLRITNLWEVGTVKNYVIILCDEPMLCLALCSDRQTIEINKRRSAR